jgi:hypothetical protein
VTFRVTLPYAIFTGFAALELRSFCDILSFEHSAIGDSSFVGYCPLNGCWVLRHSKRDL